MRVLALSLAIGLLAPAAYAGDACGVPGACEPGCGPTCEKQCFYNCKECPKCGSKLVCKVVCETREVKKTVYTVKCEPFCTSLPGCGRCCGCGDADCGGCDVGCCADQSCGKCKKCCDPCAVENAKKIVPPKCGIVRCKKTLEKKEVVCKVPCYKCVPVCPCCDGCGNGCGVGCGAEGAPAGGEQPADGTKATTMQRLPMAPLPPVIGTSYRK